MKKRILGLIACLMTTAMVFGTAGCGGGGTTETPSGGANTERPAGTKIVVYAGGSSEFSWIAGSEETQVIDYIENAYWEDTGKSLDFDIAYLGEDMQTKLSSELAAGSQIDIVISHTRGGVGVDDKLKGEDSHYNLYDALYDYAPNLYEKVKGAPLNCLTTVNNDVVGIPSVISPYKFGILVRKDYMEACGYTDDPDKAGTPFKDGQNYQLVDNLDTFAEMCRAMNSITGSSYAVTGAAWDLEKVLTLGAYADAGYFSSALVEENGRELIMTGGSTQAYKDVLALEYQWAMTGVISKDANSILLEEGESNFISGKTGVFVQDPTIQHLIKVSRMTKARDPEAEFTVLGPLKAHKDSPDDQKGFMRNPEATFAAVIPKSSTNVTAIMGFLNWVYANEDNYNLCRYGIEGTHWVDNGDGTYSYPEGKENYATQPPYSGILTLVENQNMSNLIYEGYSEEELRWINEIAGNPENYIDNDVMDYLFVSTDRYNTIMANAADQLYSMAVDAWTGKSDPLSLTTSGETVYDSIVSAYNRSVEEVQEYYTTQYKTMKAQRETD